jgi:hypothetical protein
MAERPAVPRTPGNAGRGKGPQFRASAGSGEGQGNWHMPITPMKSRSRGQHCTPKRRKGRGVTGLSVGDRVNRLVREPDAENPHVRFDERGVETEHGGAREAPMNESVGQRIGSS